MNFRDAVEIVLKFEGGYANAANDSGGETKFGISKRAYPNLDIKNLSATEAVAIYKRDYWDAVFIDRLPASCRLMVFDAAVNQGAHTAIVMLQTALGVLPDGQIGPITLAAASAVKATDLLHRYARCRQTRYLSTKSFGSFGAGWLNRLVDVMIECLKRIEEKT